LNSETQKAQASDENAVLAAGMALAIPQQGAKPKSAKNAGYKADAEAAGQQIERLAIESAVLVPVYALAESAR
jgi:hypothetical protein